MLSDILKDRKVQLTATAVLSAGVGAAVGILISSKRVEAKYNDIAEREIADAKHFYNTALANVRAQKPGTPAEVLAELHGDEAQGQLLIEAADALTDYQGISKEVVLTVTEELTLKSNLFEDNVENTFDIEQEMLTRDETKPYLISEEEWLAGDPGYNQINITYYAGDGVLTDQDDKVIDNWEDVVGENYHRFGDGTEDEDTMFIRNHKHKVDLEVTRNDKSFVHEVLGFQHSSDDWDRHDRPLRKFRDSDE